VNVFASNPTHVILDVTGYYAPPSAGSLDFFPAAPCRILDTRDPAGPFGGPMLGSNQTRTFMPPQSACNVPSTAKAYSLNATVVPPAPLGFLTLWGSGTQPGVSTLNAGDGLITSNAALIPAGAGGMLTFFPSNPTNVILDVNGYFQ
jgi:hypothetical protein